MFTPISALLVPLVMHKNIYSAKYKGRHYPKSRKESRSIFHFLNQPSGINNIPFRQRHAHSSMLMNTPPRSFINIFLKTLKTSFYEKVMFQRYLYVALLVSLQQ